jgi:hypothetical protein
MASHVSYPAKDSTKLAVVKVVHSVIYVVMAGASLVVFGAGVIGRHNVFVWMAAGLVALEGVIFVGNGMRCPLTTLAQSYGDPSGHVGDTLFPEACTRYTFRAFGTIYMVGLLLIAIRYLA